MKSLRKLAIAAGAVSLFAAVPLLSHAATCTSSFAPAPHASSSTTPLPSQVDSKGKVWTWNNGSSAAEAGISGSHGWAVAQGSTTTGLTVRGYESDTGLNGSLSVAPAGGVMGTPNVSLCVNG